MRFWLRSHLFYRKNFENFEYTPRYQILPNFHFCQLLFNQAFLFDEGRSEIHFKAMAISESDRFTLSATFVSS